MQEQPGDNLVPVFSFMGNAAQHPSQMPCWITHTNERTHDIIRSGLDRSPMYTGVIEGVGHVIAQAWKIKFIALPIKNHIKYF